MRIVNLSYGSTLRGHRQRIAFVIGWLIIFSGMIGAATVALGFTCYFHALFGTLSDHECIIPK